MTDAMLNVSIGERHILLGRSVAGERQALVVLGDLTAELREVIDRERLAGTFARELFLTGKELTGERTGQTFTIDHFPELSGQISQDHKSLTLASDAPTEEDVTFSNGDVQHRICHRSRVLLRQ